MIAHRRQMRLQVYLPLGLSALAVIALVVGLWLGGVGDAGTWADVAVIMLLIPALLVGLIVLAAFIALAVLVGKLIGIIQEPAYRAQVIAHRVRKGITNGTDLALRPLLEMSAAGAVLRAVVRMFAALIGIK